MTSVRGSIASGMSSGATSRIVTPRCSCAMNGKRTEAKSMSGASTRVPSGSEAATRPMRSDTVAAIATVSGATRTSAANSSRAASVASPQCSQLVRPARQSASAVCIASHPQSGGSP